MKTLMIAAAWLIALAGAAHAEEPNYKELNVCQRFLDAHPIVDGMPRHGDPVGDAQENFMFKYAVEQVRRAHKDPHKLIGILPLRMFVYDWCSQHPDESMVRAMYGYVAVALGELTVKQVLGHE
jgi:hypothetical protein